MYAEMFILKVFQVKSFIQDLYVSNIWAYLKWQIN